MFVSVVWRVSSLVSTRVGVVVLPSCTEPDPRVTGTAIIFLIVDYANSCFRMSGVALNIKTFSVAVELQGSLRRIDQSLPFIASQCGGAAVTIPNQGEERASSLVQYNEPWFLLTGRHTEADLGKGRVPIGC